MNATTSHADPPLPPLKYGHSRDIHGSQVRSPERPHGRRCATAKQPLHVETTLPKRHRMTHEIESGLEVVPRPATNLRNRVETRNQLPDEIMDIDRKIADLGGWTTSIEMMPQNLQKFKGQPAGSRDDQIADLLRQIGHLRQEVALLRSYRNAWLRLRHQTHSSIKELQDTLMDVDRAVEESERSMMGYWRGQKTAFQDPNRF